MYLLIFGAIFIVGMILSSLGYNLAVEVLAFMVIAFSVGLTAYVVWLESPDWFKKLFSH